VRSNLPGTQVQIDGRPAPTLPWTVPLRLTEGPHQVGVAGPDGRGTRTILIVGGQTTEEVISVAVRASTAPLRSPPEAPRRNPVPDEAPTPGRTQRTWGWVTLLLGVGGFGVGTYGVILREGSISEYNRTLTCPGAMSFWQPYPCNDLIDSEDRGQALAIGGFVAGGALALTGVILLATAASGPATTVTRAHLGPGPGSLGLSLSGLF
jgi:hypothetical protein